MEGTVEIRIDMKDNNFKEKISPSEQINSETLIEIARKKNVETFAVAIHELVKFPQELKSIENAVDDLLRFSIQNEDIRDFIMERLIITIEPLVENDGLQIWKNFIEFGSQEWRTVALTWYDVWREALDQAFQIKEDETYLFSWDNIPGNDSQRLIEFLTHKFDIDWIKTAEIEKIDDGRTIRLTDKNNFLSLELNNKKTEVNLEINYGETYYELIVKIENSKLNIYDETKKRVLNCLIMALWMWFSVKPDLLFGLRSFSKEFGITLERPLHQIKKIEEVSLKGKALYALYNLVWDIQWVDPEDFPGYLSNLEKDFQDLEKIGVDEDKVKKFRFISHSYGRRHPAMAENGKEPVFLGVSAPEAIKPGDIFTAHFVAYIKSLEEKVRQELSELSRGRSESHMGVENCNWKIDTRVIVKLSGRYLKVNPSESEFIWKGERNIVNFVAEVSPDALEWTVLLYEVFIEGIRVAFIPLNLKITSSIKSDKMNITTIEPAHTAFASYASQDRVRVLDRVAAVRISAHLDIFMDCLSIHPGEEWKKRLESEIEKRDIFLLFWSANAKNSEWVAWEWKTALAKKGESALQLHPLQTINEAPPPEELKKFHFGDVYMEIRNAQEKKG